MSDDFKAVFDEKYPLIGADGEPTRMPFQGAWPIDFWQLEETAFTKHPELWWPNEPQCECGKEAATSYKERYYCREHFKPNADLGMAEGTGASNLSP